LLTDSLLGFKLVIETLAKAVLPSRAAVRIIPVNPASDILNLLECLSANVYRSFKYFLILVVENDQFGRSRLFRRYHHVIIHFAQGSPAPQKTTKPPGPVLGGR